MKFNIVYNSFKFKVELLQSTIFGLYCVEVWFNFDSHYYLLPALFNRLLRHKEVFIGYGSDFTVHYEKYTIFLSRYSIEIPKNLEEKEKNESARIFLPW